MTENDDKKAEEFAQSLPEKFSELYEEAEKHGIVAFFAAHDIKNERFITNGALTHKLVFEVLKTIYKDANPAWRAFVKHIYEQESIITLPDEDKEDTTH